MNRSEEAAEGGDILGEVSRRTPAAVLEERYRRDEDPWGFLSSPYELSRFDTVIAALGTRRYAHALEPGCSIGTLTERLAGVCGHVHAVDVAPSAVRRAQERCAGLKNVTIRQGALDTETLPEPYDLLVFSEVGYYFRQDLWAAVASAVIQRMRPGTTLLASHWLGVSEEHRQSGDAVHRTLLGNPLLRLDHAERHEGFRLDRLVRRG